MANVMGHVDLSSAELSNYVCSWCNRGVKNKIECIKCKGAFHSSCYSASLAAKKPNCYHERDTQKTEEESQTPGYVDPIMNFLKSEEFFQILREAVKNEVAPLRAEIITLRAQLETQRKTFNNVLINSAKNSDKNPGDKPQSLNNDNSKSVILKLKMPPKKNIEPPKEKIEFDKADEETNIVADRDPGQEYKDRDFVVENVEEEEVWEIPKKNLRRKKKPAVLGTAIPENEENFAAPIGGVRGWFHIGRTKKETSCEDIDAYIMKRLPNSKLLKVEKLVTLGKRAAFKVGIDFELIEKIKCENFWPKGVSIRRFNFTSNTSKTITSNQNFRSEETTTTPTQQLFFQKRETVKSST